MILSILIRTLPSRFDSFNALYVKIDSQISQNKLTDHVEVLHDNRPKPLSSGEKANDLIRKAKGKYIVFIDDDDDIEDYYVKEMVKGCAYGCDCIGIRGKMTTNGQNEIEWRLSKDYENETIIDNGRQVYLRKTNHITAVLREHALKAPFPHISNAEDKGYSEGVNRFLKTEYKLPMPMYHYKYITTNKEY